MDAAFNYSKRTALFLATALLVAAPICAVAQNLTVTPTTVTLSRISPCDHQAIQVISQGAKVAYTAVINYAGSDPNGAWLYTEIDNGQLVSAGGAVNNGTAPATGSTTPSTLIIGRANQILVSDSATVVVTPAGGTPVSIGVSFDPNSSSCSGGNTGAFSVSPTTLSLSVAVGASVTATLTVTNTSFQTLTFPAPTSSDTSWLSATAPGPLASGGSVNITVTANAANFGNITKQGTLTFAPQSGGTPITVTVGLTVGTGGTGSNGSVSATPSTLTLSAGTNPQYQAQVTLANTTTSAVNFTFGLSPANSWLGASTLNNVTSIPAGGQVFLTVTGAPGTYTTSQTGSIVITPSVGSQLTIGITMAIGAGPIGTLTLGGKTTNTATVNFSFLAGTSQDNLPLAQLVPIQDASASSYNVSAVNYAQSTAGSWLLVNGVTPPTNNSTLSANSYNVQISLSAAAAALPAGNYTATVPLTASDLSTAAITVNLFVSGANASGVTVAPATNFPFNNVQGGTTTAQTQAFQVNANSGTTLVSASLGAVDSPGTWLSFSQGPTVSGSQITFTIAANPSGLAAGTYHGNIVILSTPAGGGTQQQTLITITLPIVSSSGGGGTPGSVVPAGIVFAYQLPPNGNQDYTDTGNTSQAIVITGTQGAQYSATKNAPWLIFPYGDSLGTIPHVLRVNFNPNGITNLSAQSYSDIISVTTPDGTTQVTVTLKVDSNPQLIAKQASTVFNYQAGGANPAPQSVSIIGTDGSIPTVSVSTTTPWLTASASGNSLTLSANPNGLQAGAYAGTVTVNSSGYSNSGMNYPVILVIAGSANNGPLTLSATGLTFSAVVNGNPPSAQNLTVNASIATSFAVTSSQTNCNTATWLSLSANGITNLSALNTPQTIVVTVNPRGLPVGQCSANIQLTTSVNGQPQTQTVPVTFTISNTGGGGNSTIASDQSSLTFNYQAGGSTPSQQVLHLTSAAGAGVINFTINTSVQTPSNVNWLSAGLTSSATPVNLAISVQNLATIPAGSYSGSVTLTPTSPTGPGLTIPVTLVVTAAPSVTATPSAIPLSYQLGGTVPTGAIQVSGGTGLTFSATASSTGNWLSVTPTSGTTGSSPVTLTVNIDPSSLNAGQTYSGTITVAGTGSATGSTVITVSLKITAPLPTITKITNGASFVSGPVSPGEIISIFADPTAPIGPATGVGLTSTSIVNGQLPTTLGGVQVVFLPRGDFAPLIYASATQINAVVPYEEAGIATPQVEVRFLGQSSNAIPLTASPTSPSFFTANGSGGGPGAISEYDASGNFLGSNSSSNPVPKGGTIVLYATGEGLTSPASVTGKVTTAANGKTPQPILAVAVTVDGQPANVTFYGEAPGLVSGVLQLNVQIPANARTGALPVVLTVGPNSNQSVGQQTVTVSVQ